MALTLNSDSVISGKLAECYFTIDGNRYNFAQALKVEAKFEISKSELSILGKPNKVHKPSGWKGTGNAAFRYNTTVFRDMMARYKDTSKFVYFDMEIKNLDPQAEKKLGSQRVWLLNCCIDSGTLAKFDVDSDVLDEDISFTYDDFKISNKFKILNEMKG